jgi:hypothetical protein
MPRGDGTGPSGMGPMTGRAAGYCAGFDVPGAVNPGFAGMRAGRGFRGGGFGWRHRFLATGIPRSATSYDYLQGGNLSEKEELEILKSQEKALSLRLEELKNRLNELNRKQGQE